MIHKANYFMMWVMPLNLTPYLNFIRIVVWGSDVSSDIITKGMSCRLA